MEWTQFALCLLLGALAVADYKKREIPLWPIAAVLCIGILNLHMQHYRDWRNVLGGIGVGAVLLLLSKATSGRIGAGDGLVIMAVGIFAGLRSTLLCLCAAFFLASFGALFLLCVKRAGKDHKMPFIPYIFAAYILTVCMQTGGSG